MRFTSAEKTAARQYSPTALHITASPTWVDSASSARESSQRVLELLRRQQSQTCSYGTCGSDCLSQGSFCCNPAGPEFDVPKWICDNGACITSARGENGIVDCYDPDNPSGTTQSCIDHVATTTCHSSDRCYTCEVATPYCHWQTYIASNSPTLSWFYCVETPEVDAVFFASTITGNISSTATPSSSLTSTSSSAASVSSTATSTQPSPASGPQLSTGAIAGIAAGGGILLIILIALCAFLLFRRRKERQRSAELSAQSQATELPSQWDKHPTAAIGVAMSPQSPYSYSYEYQGDPDMYIAQAPQRRRSPAELSSHQERWEK